MKKLNYLVLALITVLSSCDKDDNILTKKSGKVEITINGKKKEFDSYNRRININTFVFRKNDEQIGIRLPSQSNVKPPIKYDKNTSKEIVLTYSTKKNDKDVNYKNNTKSGEPIKSNFKIEISKYKDKKSSGSFEFTVYNKKNKKDAVLIKGTFTDVPDGL